MLTPAELLLSDAELVALTGYKRASEQIAELHRQGFSRARRNRLGKIVLERTHFRGVLSRALSEPLVDISGVYAYQSFHANSAMRAAAIEQRTPAWVDRKAIASVYAEARRISAETGIVHHVDHEIPLQGRLVSGLHVASNLRVLRAEVNVRKSNRFEVE